MHSSLRVRTRKSFGFGQTGSVFQHCYELAHMTKVSDLNEDSDESAVWSDATEQEFFRRVKPPIYLVEKMCLHFSEHFDHRLSWSSSTGISLKINSFWTVYFSTYFISKAPA